MHSRSILSHVLLGISWLINSITPHEIPIFLSCIASIAAIVNYCQQVFDRWKEKRVQEKEDEPPKSN
jgi:hypothetical protein